MWVRLREFCCSYIQCKWLLKQLVSSTSISTSVCEWVKIDFSGGAIRMLIFMVTFCNTDWGGRGREVVWVASDWLTEPCRSLCGKVLMDLTFGLDWQTKHWTLDHHCSDFVFFLTLSFCVHRHRDSMMHNAAAVTERIMSNVTINTVFICQYLMTHTLLLLHCLLRALRWSE